METTSTFLLFLVTELTLISCERLFHNRDRSDIQTRPAERPNPALSIEYAQVFLYKYGWLEPVRWDSVRFRGAPVTSEVNVAPADISVLLSEGAGLPSRPPESQLRPQPTLNPKFIGALRRFQEANGLPVTGILDEATREAMNTPRCGVPDRKISEAGSIHSTDMEAEAPGPPVTQRVRKKRSHLLRAGKKKETFTKRTIKWRLLGEGYSVWLTIDQQRSILTRAFRIWSEVVPLDFEEDLASPADLIDIKLGFGTRRHLGCSQLFDGIGREFAHAWQLGDIHFNDDEHFVPPNSEQGISLLKVAVHEIGHVLGLSHMNELKSVMQPNYIPANSGMELDTVDRRAIQRIYGRCSGRFSAVFDWLRPDPDIPGKWIFRTYFFRQSWYWMYENVNKRPRYRDPRRLASGWRGVPPSNIDAVIHIWGRGRDHTYFVRGTQYWRYDNDNDQAYTQDPEGVTYPRLISEGFPGISGPIDTAFYDPWDKHVYFFRGPNVTAFNVANHKVVPGYPKAILEVFPPLSPADHPVSDLDSAYFSFTHMSVFFIKEAHVWRMAKRKETPEHVLLPRVPVNEQWHDICDVHPSMLSAPRT